MNKDRLQFLIDKYQEGSLSPSEKEELDRWESALENEEGLMDMYNAKEQLEMKDRVWEGIRTQAYKQAKVVTMPVALSRTRSKKSVYLKYAAAVFLIAGATIYFANLKTDPAKEITAQQSPAPVRDVAAPSATHATITLAGGQRISLESATNGGILAKEGNVSIQMREDGHIVYSGTGTGQMQYNTLSVPRGSAIASIVLSDGTKVYLNAASSLTYPVAFTGSDRRVQITGEAYFEVAKDKSRKFVVTSGAITTEVLGTHFNINTYPDEETAKVTLLEGSVKVSEGSLNTIIKPGDQAAIEGDKLHVNESVDVDQVMSWKNGVFNFNNASCETVMRQLARWYDIEILYPKGIPAIQFGGEIQKTLALSEMLDALGEVEVKFEINNKKLIVLP